MEGAPGGGTQGRAEAHTINKPEAGGDSYLVHYGRVNPPQCPALHVSRHCTVDHARSISRANILFGNFGVISGLSNVHVCFCLRGQVYVSVTLASVLGSTSQAALLWPVFLILCRPGLDVSPRAPQYSKRNTELLLTDQRAEPLSQLEKH